MNSHQNTTRITDVVPANFLCDHQTMQKITDSQLVDEKALSLLESNLSVLESRQRRLKAELTAVELLISEAVAEQTRLRSSIETHKSLLAYFPVRALTGEILSKIFLHYIAVSQPTVGTVFKEMVAFHRTQACILQVCRRWRTTALANPRLWTTIPLLGSGADLDDKEHWYYGKQKLFAHDYRVNSKAGLLLEGFGKYSKTNVFSPLTTALSFQCMRYHQQSRRHNLLAADIYSLVPTRKHHFPLHVL